MGVNVWELIGRVLGRMLMLMLMSSFAWAAPQSGNDDDPIRQTTPAGTVFHDCALCPQMVVVPAGSFLMGSPETELGREVYEGPQHRVMILKPFAVGRFEVTRDDWQVCVVEGPCQAQSSRTGMGSAMLLGAGRLPMVDVTWAQAREYVAWLGERTGQPYRLLSEAEWEYVARAGSQSAYGWGNVFLPERANVQTVPSSGGAEHAEAAAWHVGSAKPNAFGLYDLQGNVWEWVSDCFHDSLAGAPAEGSAWMELCSRSSGSEAHMARGGSWRTSSVQARAAHRAWAHRAEADIGFRVARDLTP